MLEITAWNCQKLFSIIWLKMWSEFWSELSSYFDSICWVSWVELLKFELDFKINLASLFAAASKFSARYDNNAFDLRIGRVAERQRNLFVTLNDSVFNYVSLTSNIYAAELGNNELYIWNVHYCHLHKTKLRFRWSF